MLQAAELWYSYSMQVRSSTALWCVMLCCSIDGSLLRVWVTIVQVRFAEGSSTIMREAIVPYACLLNHSAGEAGIRQYGTIQAGWLHFTAARSASAGQQVNDRL